MEFQQLRQDIMSVVEYMEKFKRLCKFSTVYKANPYEKWKCITYQGGLRAEVLIAIAPLEIQDFSSLVSKCQVVEECTKKLVSERPLIGSKTQQDTNYQKISTDIPQKTTELKDCTSCGKQHRVPSLPAALPQHQGPVALNSEEAYESED
ncbi:uncharacterized protein LOC130957054 [Arachis stenosperma]|uniref:uncharacterized protein LOC130957054 n=1 Tax=Arachis stenosperma TaxID=217475 RepID=UPI0025ACFCDF|nr:uncharacterized protein LOC130957054 [Arachis stenosperma]